MTTRPVPPHLHRQMLALARALEALPPGATLHVTRERSGLRWQAVNQQPVRSRPVVPLPPETGTRDG